MPDSLPPILLEVETAASPANVWSALTEPERIADWFTEASPLGQVGSEYRLDFGDGSIVEGVITELEPGHHFSHTWAWADADAESDPNSHPSGPLQSTLVSWSVEAIPGGGSRVTLTHDGWTEAGLDETARDDHEGYWVGYLDDLAAILEPDG
jgi:uncharacterized protein YndB with AHSA1/START domain